MDRMGSCLLSAIALAGLFAAPAASEEAKPAELIYSPWTKFCIDAVCFIGMQVNTECGVVAAAVLIEKTAEAKRTLRVTLPVRTSVERGARITIDQGQPVTGSFVSCFSAGCLADHEGGAGLVEQLLQGQTLFLEGVDVANVPIRVGLPLQGFAAAYDGPEREPIVLEEMKLSQKDSEQQKRAEEARKARCDAATPLR
jgi:invasion protein IalB